MAKTARMVMNGKEIVVVGSINIDLVARAERIPLAGGLFTVAIFKYIQAGRARIRPSLWHDLAIRFE
jgi:hypothetical protein